jgi:pimeloyl-ACP methyl ester carboxylesterase
MSRRRNALIGAAVLGAGVVAGAALEELLYRRVFRSTFDPESDEPIGSIPGEPLSVKSFDGTLIHCLVYGPADAPLTVVFAHGVLESHLIWHYQVKDLLAAGDLRLVAFDARGHGASGAARGPDGRTPFTEYTQGRDFVAVVEQATKGPVVLVGHSMGGMAIQALWQHGEISHIRDRVRANVLVNTTFTADLAGWRGEGSTGERLFERFEDIVQRVPMPSRIIDRVRPGLGDLTLLIARLVYGEDPSPRHIAVSARIYAGTPSETIQAGIDLAHFDAHDSLPLIDVPTLVITGTKDIITPQWLSEEIALRVPGAELVVFEDCGHMANFERHDEVSSHLAKLCARLSEASEASRAPANRGGSGGRSAPGRTL